jgi:hypothetical protein
MKKPKRKAVKKEINREARRITKALKKISKYQIK